MTKEERNNYNITLNHGLLILKINEQSSLTGKDKVNQVITHIQGIKINKSSDFSIELLKYAPNETITLTICDGNGNNSQDIQATLIKR